MTPETFEQIAARNRTQIAARIRTPDHRRRRRRTPAVITPPVVVADRPDAAWSWDITDLPGPYVGVAYKFYCVTDIYSRRIVAYRVEARESKILAADMFAEAFARTRPGVVHADSGAAMVADTVTGLFARHGVVESHSRPRVSNDNPYSESVFATMKTSWDYPGVFDDCEHARSWVDGWVARYNADHFHSGVGYYPPDEVYDGTWTVRRRRRQQALDDHYAKYPGRYRTPPVAGVVDAVVGINLNKNP